MNILFVHGNYPAQFRYLAEALGEQGIHDVRFLTGRQDHAKHQIAGVGVSTFEDIAGSSCSPHRLVNTTDQAIQRGEMIQAKILEMAQAGFVPQLIFVHGGNGLGCLIKELIPDCTLIGYFEWHFGAECAETLLGNNNLATRNMVRLRNLLSEHEILHCDAAVVPTRWQASQFPALLQNKLEVVFDGIDTSFFQPPAHNLSDELLVLEGESGKLTVNRGELLLSYATRGMEPVRGFPEFMRALPPLLKRLPQLKVLVGGRDRSAYGMPAASHGGSWKALLLDELGTFEGQDRIAYTGLMNYGHYRRMLQRTNLHCYFTKPYVTSWSLFEAAACGTPVLTNSGPATTGVLPIPGERAVDWAELSAEPLARRMEMLLLGPQERRAYLPAEFEQLRCREQWQGVINRALQRSKR